MNRITFGKGVPVLPNQPGDPLSFQAKKYQRPLVTKTPTINGSGTVGAAQSFTPGIWIGSPTVTATWFIDQMVVGVGLTYTPVAADRGKTLTVLERAVGADGLAASSRSPGVVIP